MSGLNMPDSPDIPGSETTMANAPRMALIDARFAQAPTFCRSLSAAFAERSLRSFAKDAAIQLSNYQTRMSWD
jgi:hypothetical protein